MDSEAKSKREVKIVYADYDYKSGVSQLKFGNAIIRTDGTAMIRVDPFGVVKRGAGEYVLADIFAHDWKTCIRKRAEEMAQEIIDGGKNAETKAA